LLIRVTLGKWEKTIFLDILQLGSSTILVHPRHLGPYVCHAHCRKSTFVFCVDAKFREIIILRAIDGFRPSVESAALMDDRSLAPSSTDRAARSTDTNSVVGSLVDRQRTID